MDDQLEEILELRRRARSRLRLPAMFMMIMAMLGIAFAGVIVLSPHAEGAMPRGVFVLAIMWCGFIGYGAWEMDRLGNCRMACIGAWMAVIPVPVPCYLLWMIGAILALVALNDPAVRMAFASNVARRRRFLDHEARRKGRPKGKAFHDFMEDDSATAAEPESEPEPKQEESADQEHRPPEEENREPVVSQEPLPSPDAATLRDRRKNFAGQAFDEEFNESPSPGEGDRRKQQSRRKARKLAYRKEDARRAVSTASVMLFVMWTLGAVAAAGFLVVAVYSVILGNAATVGMKEERPILVVMGVIYPMAAAVGLYGAMQLSRFQSLSWGVVSAVLAMIAFPGCILSLALGVWVMILLNRPGVWHLFQRDEQEY